MLSSCVELTPSLTGPYITGFWDPFSESTMGGIALGRFLPLAIGYPRGRFRGCSLVLHTSETTEAGTVRSFLRCQNRSLLDVDEGAGSASLAV